MSRLLLIGWDSADWRLLRPLLQQGKLPHLQGLLNAGVSGNLATLQPVLSPMLWTSIATGKRAHKHGILGFIEPDPVTGHVRPVTTLSRKTKAIWNILSQSGRRCNVVGWWPSHPAEPINGVMVSNHFQPAVAPPESPWPVRPGAVHPTRLINHLAPLRLHPLEVNGDTLLPFVPEAAKIDQTKDHRLAGLAKIIAENAGVHAVATGIMPLEPWDFMAVYYDGLDHFGHGFMRYHPPRQPDVSPGDFELFSGVMEAACRFHDAMLGVLLRLAGPDTRVLLVSDHGFHPDHLRPQTISAEPAGPALEHRAYGIFVMAGPGIPAGTTLPGASLLDIVPTILQSFGLPAGEDMDGKVLPVFSHPPRPRIPSWDAVPGEAGLHPPQARLEVDDNASAIRQLVALGYVEEPKADAAQAAAEARRELDYHLALDYLDAGHHALAKPILNRLWQQWPEESRFGVKLLQCALALPEKEPLRPIYQLLEQRRQAAADAARQKLDAFLAEKQQAGIAAEAWTPAEKQFVMQMNKRAEIDWQAMRFFEAQVALAEARFAKAYDGFKSLLHTAHPLRRRDLQLLLGETSLRQRDWKQALEHFHDCLAVDEETAPAHLGLARAHLLRRSPMNAATHALRAIDLDSRNPRAYFFYGVALVRLGHPDWALDFFHQAVQLAPLFPGAHRRLAGLYARRFHNPEKALLHQELAVRDRIASATPPPARQAAPAGDVSASLPFHKSGNVSAPREAWITVVTGLPRSGTSMMMQVLAAGGLPPLTDNLRTADASNEKGYLEFERVRKIPADLAWLPLAQSKAVKIVVPLVQHLPPDYAYKIIFMVRPLAEILHSQMAMLERLGKTAPAITPDALERIYSLQLQNARNMLLALPQADCLEVSYHDALNQPDELVQTVTRFLGLEELATMRAAIHPGFRHFGRTEI